MLTGRKWRLKDLEIGDIIGLWNNQYKIMRMSPQIIMYKIDHWGSLDRSAKVIYGSKCMMIVELIFTKGMEDKKLRA